MECSRVTVVIAESIAERLAESIAMEVANYGGTHTDRYRSKGIAYRA